MKALIEKVIRLRNPLFKFDAELNSAAFWGFIVGQMGAIIRGWKLIFRFRNPKMAMLGRRVKFFNLPKIKFGKFMILRVSISFKF